MPSSDAQRSLPLADDDTYYRCPGEQQPVSRAVHLGRLAAGYAACEQCAWRFEAEHTDEALGLPTCTGAGIRRTRYGVRGSYINAIDRRIASRLTTILTAHFQRSRPNQYSSVVVGYGSHHGSPDLFAGVVSAALQNGCDVLDAGRCSAASMQHCLRMAPTGSCGLLVTGAGESSSADIGIDIICRDGRPLAVPWADFGLGVMTSAASPEEDPVSILKLPDDLARTAPRAHRHSGNLSSIASEDNYRDWLTGWWPATSSAPISIVLPTEVQSLRPWVQELTGDRVVQTSSPGTGSRPTEDGFTVVVHADDRRLTATSRRGRRIPAEELATWINTAHRSTNHHVTAHVSAEDDQLWLCDVAAPDTGDAQDVINDALAVTGLIATLSRKNPLPS